MRWAPKAHAPDVIKHLLSLDRACRALPGGVVGQEIYRRAVIVEPWHQLPNSAIPTLVAVAHGDVDRRLPEPMLHAQIMKPHARHDDV